ncbi:MAG TPA: hypothetical protein H9903_10890 [Candidatus Aquabacterium excrementipullorum]|nr:hypothetical protein [Candidatus Aquabacterium excrementipullorum]
MLVVALIMMAVIALSSSVALKGALSQDIVSANQRARSVAAQAAEAALRYCEASVMAATVTPEQLAIQRAPALGADQTPLWAQAETWAGGNQYVNKLPGTFNFDGSTAAPRNPPECLIQEITLTPMPSVDPTSPTPEAYIITARGFSPDFDKSANGTPTAGAVVWLQSSVQILR